MSAGGLLLGLLSRRSRPNGDRDRLLRPCQFEKLRAKCLVNHVPVIPPIRLPLPLSVSIAYPVRITITIPVPVTVSVAVASSITIPVAVPVSIPVPMW